MKSDVLKIKEKSIVDRVLTAISNEDPFDYGRVFDMVSEKISEEKITGGLCPFEITDNVIDRISERNRARELANMEA